MNADRGISEEIKVETIATGEETILEIKSTIRWPFQSSLILLVFQWRQRNRQKNMLHIQSFCFAYIYFLVSVVVLSLRWAR